MNLENWRPETILFLIIGLGIYFSVVSAVYVNFGPPAKRKAMMKKKRQEEQSHGREGEPESGPSGKDEESVQQILDSLKKEKDRSLGNIRNLEEDIRRHEERLLEMEKRKKKSDE